MILRLDTPQNTVFTPERHFTPVSGNGAASPLLSLSREAHRHETSTSG
jgi:hypothetical protein